MSGCMRQVDKVCTRCGKIYKCSIVVFDRALYCPPCRVVVNNTYWNKSGRQKSKECKSDNKLGITRRCMYKIVKDLSKYPLNPGLIMSTDEMKYHLSNKWIDDNSIVSRGNITYRVLGTELVEV